MNQISRMSGREKLFLASLFLFSLLLRLVYLFQVKSNPFFYNPTLDPLFHDLWAKSIASGDWAGHGVFFRAPFYPYFLALIYTLFGHDFLLVRVIQHIIGSFSVVVLYFLARRLFDKKTAVIAGILAATYWIFIYFEGELLLDSFLVLFDLLLLLWLYRAAAKPSFGNWFLAGIGLGLSAITRPNILVIIPFLLIWLFIYCRPGKSWLAPLKYWVWVGMGAALMILPVTVRNYIAGDDLVLIASQGGINFFIGNNPYSDGASAIVPGLGDDWDYADAVVLAEQELSKRLKPSQASEYFYKRGWDFILKEPEKSLPLLGKKFYLFWNGFEIGNNQNTYFFLRYSWLLRILPTGFWLVGPLSILGIFLALKEFRKYSLLIFFVFSYMLTIVFFFVNDRFRLPVIPFLIIFASSAALYLWHSLKSRSYQRLILAGLLLIISFWFCNSNHYHLFKTDFAQSYFSLGNLYLKQNQSQVAKAYYDSALTLNPRLPRAHLNLGLIFLGKGSLDSAGAAFARVLAINPYEEKAYNNLSAVYRLKGEYRKAIQFAREAIKLRPNYSTAYSNLSLGYQAFNQSDSSILALKQGIKNCHDGLPLRYQLAELYFKQQELELAEEEFKTILEGSPTVDIQTYDISGFWQDQKPTELKLKYLSAYHLGLIRAGRSQLGQAEYYFRRALEFKPDLPQAYANLGKVAELKGNSREAIQLYSQAIYLDSKNPVYHYNRAVSYMKSGQIDSAQTDLANCLQVDSAFQPARKLLDQLQK